MAEQTEWGSFRKAAEGNNIRLKPEAATDCATICANLVRELDNAIQNAGLLANVKGFGNIQNATELATKYGERASTGDSSFEHALRKHRTVVNDMMETFIASGRAYLENEKASAADISKYDQSATGIRGLQQKAAAS